MRRHLVRSQTILTIRQPPVVVSHLAQPLNNSTPISPNIFARLLSGSLVRARTEYGDGVPSSEGARRAGMTCIPWAPVAPTTRIRLDIKYSRSLSTLVLLDFQTDPEQHHVNGDVGQ